MVKSKLNLLAGSGAERLETAVLMMGETAVAVRKLELTCLRDLVREASLNPPALLLISATLDWVALSLGYRSRHEYASWFAPELFYSWFVPRGADEQPGTLDSLVDVRELVAPSPAASSTPRSFANAVTPLLLGTLVMIGADAEVNLLAQFLAKPVEDVLVRHFDSITALALPGQKSSEPAVVEASKLVFSEDGLLKRALGGARLEQAYNRSAINSIGRILVAAKEKDEDEPLLPFFNPEVVMAAIRDLPGLATPQQNDNFLWESLLHGSQVAKLLLDVHNHVQRARHPRHAAGALGALRAVLHLLGPRVGSPATLRYAVSIMLRMLRVPGIRSTCAIMLGMVISDVLRAGDEAIAALGALLPSIVSTLVEAVESTMKEDPPGDISHLVDLLQKVTLTAPPMLQPFLQYVDPVPPRLGMERAAHCIAAARRNLEPARQLQQFASRAAVMAPTLRRRSIKALKELFADAGGAAWQQEGGDRLTARCKPEVAAAGWRLAVLSSELSDPHLAEFAGELLALMGPLAPGTIAFDTATLLQTGTSPQGASDGGSIWPTALRLLCDYLIDESTEVVRTAQGTLRRLLGYEECKRASAALGHETRLLVEVFQPPEPSQAEATRPTSTAEVEDASLWDLASNQYDAWVCTLAYTMLRRVSKLTLEHLKHFGSWKR